MNTFQLVALISNIALTLSFVAALIFGVGQARAAARDRRERLTLDTLRNFQSREFAELMLFIIREDLPQTRDEMLAMPRQKQVMLIQFSQAMESLGLLVAERLVNIELVDKTLGSFVMQAWQKYCPMSEEVRVTMDDPHLSEYFQWLAERMEERMRKAPRQPYFEQTGN